MHITKRNKMINHSHKIHSSKFSLMAFSAYSIFLLTKQPQTHTPIVAAIIKTLQVILAALVAGGYDKQETTEFVASNTLVHVSYLAFSSLT